MQSICLRQNNSKHGKGEAFSNKAALTPEYEKTDVNSLLAPVANFWDLSHPVFLTKD